MADHDPDRDVPDDTHHGYDDTYHGFTDTGTWRERIEDVLGSRVVDSQRLDGGVTGRADRVDVADGRRVVVKTAPTPLTVEARMLRYLATHSSLPVPEVCFASDDLLVLSFVAGTDPITPAVERSLADHLAALHDVRADAVGFPFDTTAGPLPKPNPWTDSWPAFVRDHRLRYYATLAASEVAFSSDLLDRIWTLGDCLPDLLDDPDDPALLHGDAWFQNLVVDDDEVAAFLDPACYYGHPEAELTYVLWTDTGGRAFLERYRERAGVAAGFEERRAVYEVVFYCQQAWWFADVGRFEEVLSGIRTRLDRLAV